MRLLVLKFMDTTCPASSCCLPGSTDWYLALKVIRVFDAPRSYVESLANVSLGKAPEEADLADRATTANVPPLGLTNKPVFDSKPTESTAAEDGLAEAHPHLAQMLAAAAAEDGEALPIESDGLKAPLLLESPPFEEQLMQRTLWPESHKLYGHGNELVCVSFTPVILATNLVFRVNLNPLVFSSIDLRQSQGRCYCVRLFSQDARSGWNPHLGHENVEANRRNAGPQANGDPTRVFS
jgi:hypothetical protein